MAGIERYHNKSHWHTYSIYAWIFSLVLLLKFGLFLQILNEAHGIVGLTSFVLLLIITHYLIKYFNTILPYSENTFSLKAISLQVVKSSAIILILFGLGVLWYYIFEFSFWIAYRKSQGVAFEFDNEFVSQSYLPELIKLLILCEFIRQSLPLLGFVRKKLVVYFSNWD